MAVPGWPDPAFWTASIANTRIRSTARSSVRVQSRSVLVWLLTATPFIVDSCGPYNQTLSPGPANADVGRRANLLHVADRNGDNSDPTMTAAHSMSVPLAKVGTMRIDRLPETSRLAGVVTTAELREAGLSTASIRVLVRRGRLTPLDRGVYARTELAGRYDESTLRLVSALAIVGDGAVGSHYDAALVHGLAMLYRPPAGVSAVTRPLGAGGGWSRRRSIRVHTAALRPDEVTLCGGVPVTSVARTVVDLSRTTSFRAGVVAADSALYRGKMSKAELGAVIATCRRWPGIDQAKRVAEFCDAKSESPFESVARVGFHQGGLPRP